MSESLNELILSTEPQFKWLDMANGSLLDFRQECLFARQQVIKNNLTTETASSNPTSLKAAILNVAAIGISLNPALAHAYLVPRSGAICLDISYRGLVKLATDCGAIQWAKTELVYKNDTFTWKGINEAPEHAADPFSERGDVVGGYCLAKLPDGSVMIETMTRAEMDKIQATSKAANGPWKSWPDEMRKKSVTKRASKSWPQTGSRQRVDTAISVLNEHEGGSFDDKPPETHYTESERAEYKRCIEENDLFNFFALKRLLDIDAEIQLRGLLMPKAEKGKIGATNKKFAQDLAEAELKVEAAIDSINQLTIDNDEHGIVEILADCSKWTIEFMETKLTQEAWNLVCTLTAETT